MKSYKQLQEEIKVLQDQAEKARQQEIQSVITEIKAKIQEFGLAPGDLFAGSRVKGPKKVSAVKPKYRNAQTGETWSGRGKPPRWIAGQDKASFLIS